MGFTVGSIQKRSFRAKRLPEHLDDCTCSSPNASGYSGCYFRNEFKTEGTNRKYWDNGVLVESVQEGSSYVYQRSGPFDPVDGSPVWWGDSYSLDTYRATLNDAECWLAHEDGGCSYDLYGPDIRKRYENVNPYLPGFQAGERPTDMTPGLASDEGVPAPTGPAVPETPETKEFSPPVFDQSIIDDFDASGLIDHFKDNQSLQQAALDSLLNSTIDPMNEKIIDNYHPFVGLMADDEIPTFGQTYWDYLKWWGGPDPADEWDTAMNYGKVVAGAAGATAAIAAGGLAIGGALGVTQVGSATSVGTAYLTLYNEATVMSYTGTLFPASALSGGGAGTMLVSRWGRSGLEPGDWVMKGKTSYWNYFRSFKWQPGAGNQFAGPGSGVSYPVPRYTVRMPDGYGIDGTWKGVFFGQRIYDPSIPVPPPSLPPQYDPNIMLPMVIVIGDQVIEIPRGDQ